MALTTTKEILTKAQQGRYAVGAFNANNMEAVQAIVEAAEEEQAPVIVQISPGAIAYAGMEFISATVRIAGELASVPVALHYDHGTDYEGNIQCLRAGFTSLMFDGSGLPLEDNIRVSARIAEAAHACGIPLEAELGKIPKIEDYEHLLPSDYDYSSKLPPRVQAEVAELMADPDQAEEFVDKTRCDSLAVAIGSVHGMKRDIQPLNIERLAALRERTGVPLVLHGASGVLRTREDAERTELPLESHEGTLQEAIQRGLAKINVGTEINLCLIRGMKQAFDQDPKVKDMRRVMLPGKNEIKKAVRSLIGLFGSSGRADGSPGPRLAESVIRHYE